MYTYRYSTNPLNHDTAEILKNQQRTYSSTTRHTHVRISNKLITGACDTNTSTS